MKMSSNSALLAFQVLFFLFLSLTSASVVLTSVSEDICIGSYASFQCNVTGNQLTWRYNGGPVAGYTINFNNPQSIGPYNTELLSSNNGVLVSVANTTNPVTSSLDGTTIECRNSSSVTSTTDLVSPTLDVKSSSPATHISAMPIIRSSSDVSISVTWGGATCVPMYRISVTRGQSVVFDDNITSPEFTYSVPDDDYYIFSVSSYNYSGQRIGSPLVDSVCVSTPAVTVEIFPDYSNSNISILIEDASICTVPGTSCNISLTDGSSYNVMMPCTLGRIVEFTNIVIGRNYTYSVTATNTFGSSNMISIVVIPELPVSTATVITEPTNEPGFSHISPLSGIIISVLSTVLILCVIMIVILVAFCIYQKGNQRVSTTNLRTKSLDEKVMMSSAEKDMSMM